jgi:hypothetical protein
MRKIPYKEPIFTFAEACEATGAGEAWLRTFIQRDKSGTLGTKHRHGRLLFSLRDIAAIAILNDLNAHLRLAPAAAWEILDAAEAIIGKAPDGTAISEEIHVAFAEDGAALIWRMHDGVVETFSDAADERQFEAFSANQKAHIVIPMKAIFGPVSSALTIAQKWESDE